MRKINKCKPLEVFSAFVRHKKPQKWSDLPADIGAECRCTMLEKEQKGLSGYTERKLHAGNSDLHIDHFRKRALFNASDYIFNWDNLIVDEHNPHFGADYKDGDNGVKTQEEYSRIINPVNENPHDFFEYMADGEMIPRRGLDALGVEKALHTIQVFNLNHPSLKNSRADVVRQIVMMKDYGADFVLECLHDGPFPSLVEYFCRPDVFASLGES